MHNATRISPTEVTSRVEVSTSTALGGLCTYSASAEQRGQSSLSSAAPPRTRDIRRISDGEAYAYAYARTVRRRPARHDATRHDTTYLRTRASEVRQQESRCSRAAAVAAAQPALAIPSQRAAVCISNEGTHYSYSRSDSVFLLLCIPTAQTAGQGFSWRARCV